MSGPHAEQLAGREEALAWVGLGANLGNSAATLHAAIESIAAIEHTRLLAQSSFYRSAPIDASGPDFVNAVVQLATRLPARALLSELQAIEDRNGRTRPYRNAPRTLDLDLLLYGDLVIATPELELPHPRLALRAFVLAPLAEVSPELTIAGLGSVALLLDCVVDQSLVRLTAEAGRAPG